LNDFSLSLVIRWVYKRKSTDEKTEKTFTKTPTISEYDWRWERM